MRSTAARPDPQGYVMAYSVSPWNRTRAHSSQASSRFSAWFHGRSIMGCDHSRGHLHGPKAWHTRGRSELSDPRTALGHRSSDRSPSSTRSIIDPTSSPNIGSERGQPDCLGRNGQNALLPIAGMRYEPEGMTGVSGRTRIRTRLALSRPTKRRTSTKRGQGCFSTIKSSKIKRKIIGTLLSGITLAVILSTCELYTPSLSKLPI